LPVTILRLLISLKLRLKKLYLELAGGTETPAHGRELMSVAHGGASICARGVASASQRGEAAMWSDSFHERHPDTASAGVI
jgi:hypothetical protein